MLIKKNKEKAKQRPEAEFEYLKFLLFHTFHFLHTRYHPKIIDVLKDVQKPSKTV